MPLPTTPLAAVLSTGGWSTAVEDIRLWLPSSLPAVIRSAAIPQGLQDKECRLRIAQADDALEDLRRCRRILTGVNEFRRYNVDGMGQRTEGKVRTVYSNFRDKQQCAADRYHAARAALVVLDPQGDWITHFKELRQSDIRRPGRDNNMALGEGYYEISWIWLVPRNSTDPSAAAGGALDRNEFLENIKVEWARSKARAERWSEEIQLLEEEMRQVIEYFEWKAVWWRRQGTRRVSIPPALQRGLVVYAERQARVFDGLARRAVSLWVPYFRKHWRTVPKWADKYKVSSTTGKDIATDATGLSLDVESGSDSDSDSTSVISVDVQ